MTADPTGLGGVSCRLRLPGQLVQFVSGLAGASGLFRQPLQELSVTPAPLGSGAGSQNLGDSGIQADGPTRRVRDRLATARDQLATVIAQSRAATAGQRIPDRVVSLTDPDARPIKKGKLGQPVQFGYKVQLWEAEGGFVTGYTVEQGNPADVEALLPALDHHRAQFGRDPNIVATDRGYDSATNQHACRERPIRTVAIPKRGKKSAARQQEERRPAFRRAQRWHAGGEATISRLKRKYGLRRTRYRSHDRMTTGVGLGVFAHNVHRYPRRGVA